MILFRTARLDGFALDLPAVEDLLADRRDALGTRWGVSVPPEWPLPDFTEMLGDLRDALSGDPDASWFGAAIADRARGVVVGEVGTHAAPVAGVVEVGYSVLPAERGRGYAAEGLEGLLDRLREDGIETVEARAEAGNAASLRVLAKCGFSVVRSGEVVRLSRRLRG